MKFKFFILLLVSIVVSRLAFAADRPNIIIIFADDWGWGDLSCHGNEVYETPNLDRLAAEGADFQQFYVTSGVCSPSRASLMTGLFPARLAVFEAIAPGPNSNARSNQADWVDPSFVMLPRLFKQAGYVTGHFGKWHLSASGASDAPAPIKYGVDEAAVYGSKFAGVEELDMYGSAITDRAKKFIIEHKDTPFFLNIWLHSSHLPHQVTWASMDKYSHLKDLPQRIYASVIHEADDHVGEVLKTLDELGLTSKTLIVFSSDNGPGQISNKMPKDAPKYTFKKGEADLYKFGVPFYNAGTTGGYRGCKRSLYEGGVRVPFLVRWPGQTPAGIVDKNSVLSTVDFIPTFCAAAGISLPADYKGDGENMVEVLRGNKVQRTKPLFWFWPNGNPRFTVRSGDWKLVKNSDGALELYNIVTDQFEQNNVANQNAEIVQSLSKELKQWESSIPKNPPVNCVSKTKGSGGKSKDGEDE